MKQKQYPDVSPCPSRWPSKHTREERAKSVFVSGVPVGSALGGLVQLGRENPAAAVGKRLMRALPSVLRQLRQVVQQPRWERGYQGIWDRDPLIYPLYQLECVSCDIA